MTNTFPYFIQDITQGIQIHIVIALLVYGLMLIICCLALITNQQNNALKSGTLSPWLKYLPPLQTNERLLIILLWSAWVGLSITIISGSFFIKDVFAQHLSHKIFFTFLSWLVMSFMLITHQLLGWRGKKLLYAILLSFCFLLLSYSGTKLALFLIQH